MNPLRPLILEAHRGLYEGLVRPALFRTRSAEAAHHDALNLLRQLDASASAQSLLKLINRLAFPSQPVTVGGVTLPHPLILAAGFVKGDGFANEAEARIAAGRNIIPGWRSMPNLVGAVEFGSFTRWPRLGNHGGVMWRDVVTQSTQNRVGLRNPGVMAAAAFLAEKSLPPVFGLNLASTPGLDDLSAERDELVAMLSAFLDRGVRPAWFTLNLSCPNTEDDPAANQTAEKARALCETALAHMNGIPLWVKLSPGLAENQYAALMTVFAETGVRAVIATNTLGRPAPSDSRLHAGVGGGRLHESALQAAWILQSAKLEAGKAGGSLVDVIGCGGVLDGETYADFARMGVPVVQYWSALVYRGPLAAALILGGR